MAAPIAILHSGVVCSVGLSTSTTCAAIRAAVSNFSDTKYADLDGEPILGASITFEKRWRGRQRLLHMLSQAVGECLEAAGSRQTDALPLLLCVAERQRPGRAAGLDDMLGELEAALRLRFDPARSAVIAEGRASVALALAQARTLLQAGRAQAVLIAAVDSLLVGRGLPVYERQQRLLTSLNSNGFIPGEAASAVLIGLPATAADEGALVCTGIGLAQEPAPIESGEPMRGDGLTRAVKVALAEAGCELGDLDYRLTDINGEQYYFKEASLALCRVLRQRKERHYLTHPADCVGEVGAAIGPLMLALALESGRKAYGHGPNLLMHCGSDAGLRSALVLRYVPAARH